MHVTGLGPAHINLVTATFRGSCLSPLFGNRELLANPTIEPNYFSVLLDPTLDPLRSVMSSLSSPPSKRLKLEKNDEEPTPVPEPDVNEDVDGDEEIDELEDGEHCSICLQLFVDRAVIPDCAHDFCFECILKWTGEKAISFSPNAL